MARSDYYIPVFDSLPGHKKEVALREAMGWNGFESVGFLVWFWLRVAADFPDGELPGLDGLKAALKRVWKAADIKSKRKYERIQLLAEALLREEWIEEVEVDVVDEVPVLVVHDWEDGAGMFAKKREMEKEKKRRQREAARQAAGESVPGTGEVCPPTVPGEKGKGKRENIPPNPPRAGGGDFENLQKQLLSAWGEACAKVGVDAGRDSGTVRAMATLAKAVAAGETGVDALRRGMAHFLSLKHDSDSGQATRMATWGANAFARSFATYIPKETRKEAAKSTLVEMQCSACGYVGVVKLRQDWPADAGVACVNPEKAGACDGRMFPVRRRSDGF